MKRILIIYVLILLSGMTAWGQRTLVGRVEELDGKAIDGAFVALLDAEKRSLINQATTDSVGHFSISGQHPDHILLAISSPGYHDTTMVINSADTNLNLSPIRLSINTTLELSEVIVSAKPFSTTQTATGISFKVINPTLIANNNIENIIRLTPFLNIDPLSGAIQMIGKENTLVYINGRKSRMSKEGLMNYFKTLPAENIEKLEVILNPGVEYEVSPNTGIVNLSLKPSATNGFKGDLYAIVGQSKVSVQQFSANGYYVKDKFNLNAFVVAANNPYFYLIDELYNYKQSDMYSHRVGGNNGTPRQQYAANVNAVYQIDNKQQLGIVADFSSFKSLRNSRYTTDYGKSSTQSIDSTILSQINPDRLNFSVAGNLNYTLTPKKEKNQLKIDFDYMFNKINNNSRVYNGLIDQQGDEIKMLENYTMSTPQSNHILKLQADYMHTVAGQKLGVGIIGNLSNTNSHEEYNNRPPTDSIVWGKRSFFYQERGAATYLKHEKVWNNRLSTSVGIRLEYNNLKGDERGDTTAFSKDYVRLLPSASFMYVFSKSVKLTYNFSMRSQMPSFTVLSPFRFYVTATSYSEGNPKLRPSTLLSQNILLSLPIGFSLMLYQNIYYDAYNEVSSVVPNTPIIKYTTLNYGRFNSRGATLSFSNSIVKNIWFLNGNITGFYDNFTVTDPTANLKNNDKWSWRASLNNTFTLSKKYNWQLSTSTYYNSASIMLNMRFESNIHNTIILRKGIGNGAIQFMCNLPLFQYNGRYNVGTLKYNADTPQYFSFHQHTNEGASFFLSYSYNFGNQKAKVNRSQINSSDYKSRVSGY